MCGGVKSSLLPAVGVMAFGLTNTFKQVWKMKTITFIKCFEMATE